MTNTHKAIAGMVSKSESRPELMHVRYQDGKATATDAFQLIEAKSGDFVGLSGFVLGSVIRATTETAEVLSMLKPADSLKYPNTDKIINEATTHEPIATAVLNYHYLAGMAKAVGAFGSSLNDVRIEIHGAGRPVVLKAKRADGSEAIGLIMPLRM